MMYSVVVVENLILIFANSYWRRSPMIVVGCQGAYADPAKRLGVGQPLTAIADRPFYLVKNTFFSLPPGEGYCGPADSSWPPVEGVEPSPSLG